MRAPPRSAIWAAAVTAGGLAGSALAGQCAAAGCASCLRCAFPALGALAALAVGARRLPRPLPTLRVERGAEGGAPPRAGRARGG